MDDEQWAPVTERRWKIQPKTKPRVNDNVQQRTITDVQQPTVVREPTVTVITNDVQSMKIDIPSITKPTADQINRKQRKHITLQIHDFGKKYWVDPQNTKIL